MINWFEWEASLAAAVRGEARLLTLSQPDGPLFACCLEFDPRTGATALSWGSRADLEGASVPTEGYRILEIRPENWSRRAVAPADPEGHWRVVRHHETLYAQAVKSAECEEKLAFLAARLQYAVDVVLRQLVELDVFQGVSKGDEFLPFGYVVGESPGQTENRIQMICPDYQPATWEVVSLDQEQLDLVLKHLPSRLWRCSGSARSGSCVGPADSHCDYCAAWLCGKCAIAHRHPELLVRQPFYARDLDQFSEEEVPE